MDYSISKISGEDLSRCRIDDDEADMTRNLVSPAYKVIKKNDEILLAMQFKNERIDSVFLASLTFFIRLKKLL